MPVSQRIQNLQKNPSISRDSFHQVAAQMMGRKGVTDSVKKGLKKSGVFYGKRSLTKHEFEKGVRAFSEHLEKEGVKETRFTKGIRGSLRYKSGLTRGGQAERAFRGGIKAQMGGTTVINSFHDLEPGVRRKFLAKMIDKGKLSNQDRDLMKQMGLDPEKGVVELKKFAERIISMNQWKRAQEIEEEAKNIPKSARKTEEKSGSAGDYYEESSGIAEQKKPSSSPGNPSSSKTVQLQGGIGGSVNRIESPEAGMERVIIDVENEIMQNRQAEEKSAEMPNAEHSDEQSTQKENGGDQEIDDMEI
ncbi:MAG: hypothetical protein WC693_06055 [Patescibacteria group bacterium]